MRGIVNTALNERQRPNVNALVTAFYEIGDIVEVVQSVLGEDYDGDDLWYKLNTGGYVWSGAVDVNVDCSFLPNDQRDHYLLSYRKIFPDGRPNMATKEPPNKLYFAPIRLPADTESIRVNELIPNLFAEGVRQAVSQLSTKRKHVFVYIHGYQLFSSLKLDLLSAYVLNYMTHPDNSIAKVLFMAWPGQGGPSRKTVDDRSVNAGQNFTAQGLFETFKILSEALAREDKTLNLLVHSFGHQLLNGMLNPGNAVDEAKIPQTKIFKNIFLMSPDVTHLAIKQGGVDLLNYFKDDDGTDFHYELKKLTNMAQQVHVFHHKYDYLLYASTKKFVGAKNLKRASDPYLITKDYRNLGNHGSSKIAPDPVELGFNFINVEDLIAQGRAGDLLDYPYRNIVGTASGRIIDKVWNEANYDGINAEKIILNLKRFPDHHRYLYTCKPVVDEVLRLLK